MYANLTFGRLVKMLAPAPSLPPSLLPSLPETTECLPFKPCYIKNVPECKFNAHLNIFFNAFAGKDMVICVKPEEDDSFVSQTIRETVSVELFTHIAKKLTTVYLKNPSIVFVIFKPS